MKESGRMIREMVWVMKDSQMEINMKDSIKMEKLKALGDILGSIMNTMMVNGLQEINKDLELGKVVKMNNIVGNGTEISQMDMENMYGEMEMYMKENGKHV
jgi:hypothetical protein